MQINSQILACIDRVANKYEQNIKEANKEHVAQRLAAKRPPKTTLLEQRSVVGESIIPRAKPPGGDRAAHKPKEVNPFAKVMTHEEDTTINRSINIRKLK